MNILEVPVNECVRGSCLFVFILCQWKIVIQIVFASCVKVKDENSRKAGKRIIQMAWMLNLEALFYHQHFEMALLFGFVLAFYYCQVVCNSGVKQELDKRECLLSSSTVCLKEKAHLDMSSGFYQPPSAIPATRWFHCLPRGSCSSRPHGALP